MSSESVLDKILLHAHRAKFKRKRISWVRRLHRRYCSPEYQVIRINVVFQHYASRNGHCDACRSLLDFGGKVNAQTRSGGVTPLHRAAYSGHQDVTELLIIRGADVTLVDTDGKTALHKVTISNGYLVNYHH